MNSDALQTGTLAYKQGQVTYFPDGTDNQAGAFIGNEFLRRSVVLVWHMISTQLTCPYLMALSFVGFRS